jgi:hypothetical protein
MLWLVGELVVKVDEGSLDFRQALQLLLQSLPNIMALPQRHVTGKDNVHFDKVVGTKRVCPHRVNVPHSLVVVPAER